MCGSLLVEDVWCRVVISGFFGLRYECKALFVEMWGSFCEHVGLFSWKIRGAKLSLTDSVGSIMNIGLFLWKRVALFLNM